MNECAAAVRVETLENHRLETAELADGRLEHQHRLQERRLLSLRDLLLK